MRRWLVALALIAAPAMEQFAYGFDLWRAQRPAEATRHASEMLRMLGEEPGSAVK